MRRTLALAILLGGCTTVQPGATPVVITAPGTPTVVLTKLQTVCKYQAQGAAAVAAVEAALKASAQTKATTATVENLAAIACALLAPS
jgi:hypothetical protein